MFQKPVVQLKVSVSRRRDFLISYHFGRQDNANKQKSLHSVYK